MERAQCVGVKGNRTLRGSLTTGKRDEAQGVVGIPSMTSRVRQGMTRMTTLHLSCPKGPRALTLPRLLPQPLPDGPEPPRGPQPSLRMRGHGRRGTA